MVRRYYNTGTIAGTVKYSLDISRNWRREQSTNLQCEIINEGSGGESGRNVNCSAHELSIDWTGKSV